MTLPSLPPVITRRPLDQAVLDAAQAAGYSPLLARLLAARLPATYADQLRAHVSPAIAQLDPPDTLPDIAIAATTIADAVVSPDQMLVIASDHDVDGGTGAAVMRLALIEHFGMDPKRVGHVLSHKRKEGFGVSEKLVERLQKEFPPPALVVTIDQGSQDEPRFQKMRSLGYSIICTDHHHIAAPPVSALACVNPTRTDSRYPDPFISGCMVAWLVMCAVRQELIRRGQLTPEVPNLAPLLDLVAASTIADAVSISRSANNRAVVNYGLRLMNTRPRPAWTALREVMRKEAPFTEIDLAMAIGPRMNAISRMGDALPIVAFLVAKDLATAMELATHADTQNQERRAAEKKMVEQAIVIAAAQVAQGRHALTIHLEEGVSSIHGVVASRIVDRFARPTLCLSPKYGEPEQLTGSLRTAHGINILEALAEAQRLDPGCLISYGGHAGAGGVLIEAAHVERIAAAFDVAVSLQRDLSQAHPVLWSDGPLPSVPNLQLVHEIDALGPYGREFEAPLFEADVIVQEVRAIGDGTHLRMQLRGSDGVPFSAIWFSARRSSEEPLPVGVGEQVRVYFGVASDVYRGRERVDVHIRHVTDVPSPRAQPKNAESTAGATLSER